jgi:hypothetical protein
LNGEALPSPLCATPLQFLIWAAVAAPAEQENIMGSAGIRQVSYFDCAGGGQVVVENGIACVGHMRSRHGTSVIDVRDPGNLRELATITLPQGTHSRKVPVGSFQVEGIKGKNRPAMTACHQGCEKATGTEIPFAWYCRGLRMIDIADLHAPREVAHFMPTSPPAATAYRVTTSSSTRAG